MLFLQLNLWGSEERLFICNHLKWCFTRYKALSAEIVYNLRKYVEIYNGVINLGHIFSFKNGYICTKQTDKIHYNRRH